ncbi:biotin transporter BioY [Thalassospira profundimaris]|uniref:biotin transporter BioY n=1 Tax=Thalassospira profundimaris TaxID=502049 RepID=UPI000DED4D71|nr:biotin transporter BioY [Thalassospira profundimaris]
MRNTTVEPAQTHPHPAPGTHTPRSSGTTGLKYGLIMVAGIAVLTASAKVTLPFWPVPMTLQTLAVMAIALTVGPRLACATLFGYLAAGAAGLPVFAGTPERGIGLAYMVGPTGGYMLGYLVASWLVGTYARGRSVLARFGIMMAAMIPVYGLGLAWLAVYVPLHQVVAYGFSPFILGDALKIALVALASAACARLVKQTNGDRAS